MTISEYAPLAQRTASTKATEDKRGHGMMGLVGEAGEIMDVLKKLKYMGLPEKTAREKLIAELGDLMWYCVEYCIGAGLDVEAAEKYAAIDRENYIHAKAWKTGTTLDAAALICDYAVTLVKDRDTLPDAAALALVTGIINRALWMMDHIRVTPDEVLTENLDKLRARYGEKFSAAKSNARYQ